MKPRVIFIGGVVTAISVAASIVALPDPVVTLIVDERDRKNIAIVQDFIEGAKDKTAFCIVSEETELSIKRALFRHCDMKIVPRGSTTEELEAEAETFRQSKGELRDNTTIKIQ